MKIKTININKKPHIVGIGNHETGYGHFICFAHGRNVRADLLIGGSWSNVFKFVSAEVVRVEIDTDTLLSYLDYLAADQPETLEPGTVELKELNGLQLTQKPLQRFTNESKGARFDYYYAGNSIGNNGENLNGTALALHVLMHLSPQELGDVWILDGAGNIRQPVTAKLEYTERTAESDPYRLKVVPVDYSGNLADIVYSTGSAPLNTAEAWQAEPDLIYLNPENKFVYVRDSAGTVAKVAVKPENWNVATVPQTV